MSRPAFSVRAENGRDHGTAAVVAAGELDSGTSPELIDAVTACLADPEVRRVVLDLAGVSFIDSTGTHAIVWLEHHARRQDKAIEVVPPPEDVTALLSVAGVTERISLAPGSQVATSPGFLERMDLELDREPGAPGRARAEIRELLGANLDDAELATVVLLASEVVTNAVVHPPAEARGRIGMRVFAYGDRVRVEVDDSGAGFDPAVPVTPSDWGGRGLMLVDRSSRRWGAGLAPTPRGERFAVWFEVGCGQVRERAAAG